MELGNLQTVFSDPMKWMLDLVGQGGKEQQAPAKKAGLTTGQAKTASTGLGKIESSKKSEGTNLIQTREAATKDEAFKVDQAKLKGTQLQESKKLYDSQEDKKANFKSQQAWELAHFEATHKGDTDIVAKRMKFIDQQAAARGKFEKSLANENIALYNKHKGETAALTQKYYPKPKAVVATGASTAKPVATAKVSELPAQNCGPEVAGTPLPAHDGLNDDLVYIAPLSSKAV